MTSKAKVCWAITMASVVTPVRFVFMLFAEYIFIPIMKALPEELIPKVFPKFILKDKTSYNLFSKAGQYVKSTWNEIYRQALCNATVGSKAPRAEVISMDQTSLNLLDFQKPGRMLVINFGSCT